MNALCHKLVFSKKHHTLVAVGENATASGKSSGGETTRSAQGSFVTCLYKVFLGVGLIGMSGLHMGAAHAQLASNSLPTGGVVSSGSASIAATGNTMGIHQASDRASINWNSFNVGSAASVNIVQPGASSVLLNRVVGSNPSQIMGSIRANGQVMLVNPNGVVFGKGGSVTATSFTASTLGISDADFQAGNHRFTRNGSTAGVVNEGTITTTGGYVALLGASVTNDGKIVSNGGDVALAAGQSADIGVPVSRGGKVRLLLSAADINTAVANNANGIIQTDGGQVLMQAASVGQALASINQSGRIDTSGVQGGAVTLRADHGKITVNGSVVANSTDAANKAGGSIVIGRADDANGKPVLAAYTDVTGATLQSAGGFIETSGSTLNFENVGKVSAKEWLLDPTDVTINAAAATTIGTTLSGGTSVTILTDGSTAGTAGDGNITIASNITATNNTNTDVTLRLIADNGIRGPGSITGTQGTGKTGLINVEMTANGTGTPANNGGIIFVGNTINTTGDVTLTGTNMGTNNSFTQHGVRTGNITGKSIKISGTTSSADTNAFGVGVFIGGSLTATDGNIDVHGEAQVKQGVYSVGSMTATKGNVKITGLSGADSTSTVSTGVDLQGNSITAKSINILNASVTTATAISGDVRSNVKIGGTSTFTASDATGTGITITGSVTKGRSGSGVELTGTFVANGALSVTGTATDTTNNGVNLYGVINGTGDVSVEGTSSAAYGLRITGSTTATNGTVSLKGNAIGTGGAGIFAGSNGKTSAKNIAVIGKSTNTDSSANGMGYYGGVYTFDASEALKMTGTSENKGGGFYAFKGTYNAKNGVTINGNSALGDAVGFNANTAVTNSTLGNITVTGTVTGTPGASTPAAISLLGASFTNYKDGNVTLEGVKGGIVTSTTIDATTASLWGVTPANSITVGTTGATAATRGTGSVQLLTSDRDTATDAESTASIDAGALNITQHANGGVVMRTSGKGNVVVGGLVNKGTGAVELVAGSGLKAGDATGTVSLASTGTRSNAGSLKVVTGSYDSFGKIANWSSLTNNNGFGTLYYNAISGNRNNVGFGKVATNTLGTNGDDNNQILFRQANGLDDFKVKLANTTANYGTEKYDAAVNLARMQNQIVNDVTVTDTNNVNTFTLSKDDILASLRVDRTKGTISGGGYEYANTPGYAYNATVNDLSNTVVTDSTGTANTGPVHVINKAKASASAVSATVDYNGSTQSLVTASTGLKDADGDDVRVIGASARNAGTWASDLKLAGADAVNYDLTPDNNSTLTIKPVELTVRAVAATKVVDGNNSSPTKPTVTGLQGTDSISSTTSQTYDNASVGIGKTLTPATVTISDGNGGANYRVSYVANTQGVITTASDQPNVVPNLPNGGSNSQVRLSVTGSDAFRPVALEECSIDNLENCTCEDLANAGAVVSNNVAVTVCIPPTAADKAKPKAKILSTPVAAALRNAG